MDKRKLVLRFGLVLLLFFLNGCATAKGLKEDFFILQKTTQTTKADSQNIWQVLLKADKWIRENLW